MSRGRKRAHATMLSNADRGLFLSRTNWEKEPAEVDLAAALPEGTYTVVMRDDAQWNKVTLGGRDVLPHTALKRFRRVVPAEKAEVYVIRPAAGN